MARPIMSHHTSPRLGPHHTQGIFSLHPWSLPLTSNEKKTEKNKENKTKKGRHFFASSAAQQITWLHVCITTRADAAR